MEEIRFQDIRCLIRKPKDFNSEKRYPVLLFLHGAGTKGSDINKLYKNVFFPLTDAHPDFPFVTVAPLCETNSWFDVWERVQALVRDVAEWSFVDRSRIYAMGASMGGYATWQIAMSMPRYFAAIVPICGGGMYWNAGRLVHVPVWAFHGAKDTAVFLEESVKMVDAVNRCGGQAKLTVYPENDHNAWSDTYSNFEVFSWLLQHQRGSNNECADKYNNSELYG